MTTDPRSSDDQNRLQRAIERVRTEDAELLDRLDGDSAFEGLDSLTAGSAADAPEEFAGQAAELLFALAHDRGDPRLAWAATRAFCLLNRRDVHFTVDEAEQVVLAAARSDLDASELARVLEDHISDPPPIFSSR